jgi:hypothetical protein
VSLLDVVRRRFAQPPDAVRAALAAGGDADERVLAWGALSRDAGWLVATSRGLRRIETGTSEPGTVLRWHDIGHARWTATNDGGGSFSVTALTEVEPGVQARQPAARHVLAEAGDLPAVVRKRVDQTVLVSRRAVLPGGGGVLLVARRVPGQAEREWSVVFDDDTDRNDPAAREAAREKLAEMVGTDQPA